MLQCFFEHQCLRFAAAEKCHSTLERATVYIEADAPVVFVGVHVHSDKSCWRSTCSGNLRDAEIAVRGVHKSVIEPIIFPIDQLACVNRVS